MSSCSDGSCTERARQANELYRRALEAARDDDLALVGELLQRVEQTAPVTELTAIDPALVATLQASQIELFAALREARDHSATQLAELRKGQQILRRLRG